MKLKEYSEAYIQRVRETCKLNPIVILTIMGTDWELLFNNRAVMDFQSDSGINLMIAGMMDEDWNDTKKVSQLLHRGLQKKHPEVTIDIVNDDIFLPRLFPYIVAQLRTAITAFRPDLTGLTLDKEEVEATDESDPTRKTHDAGSRTGVGPDPVE